MVKLTHQEQLAVFSRQQYRTGRRYKSRSDMLIATCSALSRKATTKSEDAYGVLANLLDLSAPEVLSLDIHNRTKAILRTVPTIPLNFLLADVPRLYGSSSNEVLQCAQQDRWIPTNIHRIPMNKGGGFIGVNPDGFRINAQNLKSPSNARAFTVSQWKGRRWLGRLYSDISPKISYLELSLKAAEWDDPSHGSSAVIILSVSSSPQAFQEGGGACFVPHRSKSGLLHVTFLCNVMWKTRETAPTDLDYCEVVYETLCEDILVDCGKLSRCFAGSSVQS